MNDTNHLRHQLFIIGTGIKFKSHITLETKACIEQADKVLYLVNEPAMAEWIESTNKSALSLEYLYRESELRITIYQKITDKILETLELVEKLCVVFYGHPGVFVDPGHAALKEAKKRGYSAVMLPGISAEDCLFADLGIDPASHGCQTFEVTDFLLRDLQFDPRCHLILWQIGMIGDLYAKQDTNKEKPLKLLIEKLSKQYELDHPLSIYEAAQYPSFPAQIEQTSLENLYTSHPSPIATLYIPPKYFGEWKKSTLVALELTEAELQKT